MSEYLLGRVLNTMPEPSGSEGSDNISPEMLAISDPATYEYEHKWLTAKEVDDIYDDFEQMRDRDFVLLGRSHGAASQVSGTNRLIAGLARDA